MAETSLPSDGPENLVLRYLCRLDARLDEHTRKFDEVITRLGAVERRWSRAARRALPPDRRACGLADVRRDVAEVHVRLAAVSPRLDNLDRRVGRIKRRLDLVDAPSAGG